MVEIKELIVTEINKKVNTEMDVEKIVKEMHLAALGVAGEAIRPKIEKLVMKSVMPPDDLRELFLSPWGFLPGVVMILRGTESSTKEALINEKSSEAITELADNLGETIEAYYQDFAREMKEYQI